MVIRQIKVYDWEHISKHISALGKAASLSLQNDLQINCNGAEYILRVQMAKKRKVAALQAVAAYSGNGEAGGKNYRLIDDNEMLAALLEIVIYQSDLGNYRKD
ncbi:MAG: hypothetical protein FWC55_02980 [Firmicutes bacterium]|nr:hypothetical protein [Bacillota bacterium]